MPSRSSPTESASLLQYHDGPMFWFSIIPVQVGPATEYCMSRNQWLFRIIVLQGVMFVLRTFVVRDVAGVAWMALALCIGSAAYWNQMNISYLSVWGLLCATSATIDAVVLAKDARVKETHFQQLVLVGVVCSYLLGALLARHLYLDYMKTEKLPVWLRSCDPFDAFMSKVSKNAFPKPRSDSPSAKRGSSFGSDSSRAKRGSPFGSDSPSAKTGQSGRFGQPSLFPQPRDPQTQAPGPQQQPQGLPPAVPRQQREYAPAMNQQGPAMPGSGPTWQGGGAQQASDGGQEASAAGGQTWMDQGQQQANQMLASATKAAEQAQIAAAQAAASFRDAVSAKYAQHGQQPLPGQYNPQYVQQYYGQAAQPHAAPQSQPHGAPQPNPYSTEAGAPDAQADVEHLDNVMGNPFMTGPVLDRPSIPVAPTDAAFNEAAYYKIGSDDGDGSTTRQSTPGRAAPPGGAKAEPAAAATSKVPEGRRSAITSRQSDHRPKVLSGFSSAPDLKTVMARFQQQQRPATSEGGLPSTQTTDREEMGKHYVPSVQADATSVRSCSPFGTMSFAQAAEMSRHFAKPPPTDDLLEMYALSRQATAGDAPDEAPTNSDPTHEVKWRAWHALKGMPQQEAEAAYVNLVLRLRERFGTQ